jgi:hypothetical protein
MAVLQINQFAHYNDFNINFTNMLRQMLEWVQAPLRIAYDIRSTLTALQQLRIINLYLECTKCDGYRSSIGKNAVVMKLMMITA